MDFSEQAERIKNKLHKAKEVDNAYKVFGASDHKYILYPPVNAVQVKKFEDKYSIPLPTCYKAFVLSVGNGGISFQDSGAGPYYGIYPLGEQLDELTDPTYLNKPCILHPEMSDMAWEELTLPLDDKLISDEDYYNELGRIFSGIMPLGAQGCSYLHGLVLNGPCRGKVVNLEMSAEQKPKFAYENNFLDWYERWLDEVISGKSPFWFGYSKPEEV